MRFVCFCVSLNLLLVIFQFKAIIDQLASKIFSALSYSCHLQE